MRKNRLIHIIILVCSMVLICGCSSKKQVDSKSYVVTNVVQTDENSEEKEEVKLEVKEEVKEEVENPFITKWMKALDELQETMDGVIGINENLPKEKRDEKFQVLKQEIQDGLTDEMIIYYKLSEIISEEGIAHLYLLNNMGNVSNEVIPISMHWMGDKLYLRTIENSMKEYLGYEVVTINGYSIDEIVQRLSKTISAETESGKRCIMEYMYMDVVRLQYCDVMKEGDHSIDLNLRGTNNEIVTITVNAVKSNEPILSARLVDMMEHNKLPMAYKMNELHSGENYCFTPDPENKTMYFLYKSCAEMESLPMETFFDEMFHIMMDDDENYDRLVIDVRWNQGGNRYLLQNYLYKYRDYLNTKNIDIITGIWTASAGVQVAEDCLQFFEHVTIYGSPTAGAVKNYTEVKQYNLSNVGLTLCYPTVLDDIPYLIKKYGNVKESVMPDVIVHQTFEDFFNGIDTIYQTIIENEN